MMADPNATQSEPMTIRTFACEIEAQIAKSALEAFGIDGIFSHDNCGGQRPHLTLTGGIQLMVRSADGEPAEEVLMSQVKEVE